MRIKKVIEGAIASETTVDQDDRDLFELANLYPTETGLPMTVWVSPRGNARHDVRIKVNMTHGNQMSISNTAVVAVRPTPRLIAGQLSPADAQAVFEWVRVNTKTLVAYWSGQIGTIQMAQSLQPLPPSAQGQQGQPPSP
jgi:hypothetical protein